MIPSTSFQVLDDRWIKLTSVRVANCVQLFLSNISITCGVGFLGVVGVVYTPSGGASASCFFLQLWFGDDLSTHWCLMLLLALGGLVLPSDGDTPPC